MSSIAVAALLIAGVAIELLCCIGVLVMRGPYARLHYTAPAGLGALLIALAVVVRAGFLADRQQGAVAGRVRAGHRAGAVARDRPRGADP